MAVSQQLNQSTERETMQINSQCFAPDRLDSRGGPEPVSGSSGPPESSDGCNDIGIQMRAFRSASRSWNRRPGSRGRAD